MSYIKSIFLLLTIIAIGLTACSDDEAPRNDREIIAGSGVEGITIGNSVNEAIDVLGSDYAEFFVGQSGSIYSYYIVYNQYGVQINLDSAPEDTDIKTLNIREIILTDPYKGKTAEGIGIGSNKADVESTYPGGTSDFFADYKIEGLSFDFDDEEKVELVRVTN